MIKFISQFFKRGCGKSSSEWFHEYMDKTNEALEQSRALGENGLYQCPSCLMPTVSEPAGYEICPLCNWEDDGQEEASIDEVWGGPNGGMSLRDSRDSHRGRADEGELGIIDAYLASDDFDERLELLYRLDCEVIWAEEKDLPVWLKTFSNYKKDACFQFYLQNLCREFDVSSQKYDHVHSQIFPDDFMVNIYHGNVSQRRMKSVINKVKTYPENIQELFFIYVIKSIHPAIPNEVNKFEVRRQFLSLVTQEFLERFPAAYAKGCVMGYQFSCYRPENKAHFQRDFEAFAKSFPEDKKLQKAFESYKSLLRLS